MIFRRALLAEFAVTASAVFAVLLSILVVTEFVRVLGRAAGGRVDADAVGAILGFTILNLLPFVITLTLFIAVLGVLARCHRDSEMVIWFSSGLSLNALLVPVLMFALPVTALVGFSSLALAPWANSRADEFRRQLEARDEAAGIAAGVFRESRRADRVFFVEQFSVEDNTVRRVFVQSVENQRVGTMVAERGLIETSPSGFRHLVLLDGRRYEGVPGTPEFRIVEFERYSLRLEGAVALRGAPPAKALPTPALLADPTPPHVAELMWRTAIPVMALLLSLLAIPLSFVNPRAARSLNYVYAALIYMLYSNLLSTAQAWIAQQKLPPVVGFWAVHLAMAATIVALFAWRAGLLRRNRRPA